MKKQLLLVLLCISVSVFSQETTIPDADFEIFLEAYNMGNGIIGDNLVTTANIENVTTLSFNVENKLNSPPQPTPANISDLTGIEDFTALEVLNCNALQLLTLDLTSNVNLKVLYANDNNLAEINVSGISTLEVIECERNNLQSLFLNTNPMLTKVLANDNLLTTFHIRNGGNEFINIFRTIGNSNLSCINVDNVGYTSTWLVDATTTFEEHCSETYVPDDNFENYLETHDASGNTVTLGATNSMGNGVANDDYVTTVNIETVTNLSVSSLSISNLTGIEDFIGVLDLKCSNNALTQLTLNSNLLLQTLNCSFNSISELDLSANTNLIGLIALTNGLIFLDMRNGNNANVTSFISFNNSTLNCINVNDASASYLSTWTKDTSTSFGEHCYEIYVPDDNFENYLETHDASGNVVTLGATNSMGNGIANDDYVTTSNISEVITLSVDGLSIANLTGIEGFVALEVLSCTSNNLTSLDLSNNTMLTSLTCYLNTLNTINVTQNTNLITLDCPENQLISLDVSQNTALEYLTCDTNNLTSLDISQNTSLKRLFCGYNNLTSLNVTQNIVLERLYCRDSQITSLDVTLNTTLVQLSCENNLLTSLNVANGNNTAFTYFGADSNLGLTCINVDDIVYSTTNWTTIDTTASFSEHCYETYVPDDNFENYLETHDASGNVVTVGTTTSMGNGIANDNYVLTINIETVTALNLGNSPSAPSTTYILDLTGISGFVALEVLNCSKNNITTLDLSQNMLLTTIDCSENILTSLNVAQNTLLTVLECDNNNLTTLDVSQNSLLFNLDCSGNELANLMVTSNLMLTGLNCESNLLSSLDVTGNPSLTDLSCSNNMLTSLNVSINIDLDDLSVYGNMLTSLDVTQNIDLEVLDSDNNALTTIDLSNNTVLNYLYIADNNLQTLDVSNNSVLMVFDASSNALVSLNLKNGNNTGISGVELDDNPNLTCVLVDDATYSNTNWTNKDVQTGYSETNCNVSISALAFLQGAAINPNIPGETLMRDDLRIAGLIPTTSPYGDGLTCNASVFDAAGDLAIVDWVWLELRDANDPTIIIESRSALITRIGFIVDVDGSFSVGFNAWVTYYYVAIKHRNHLGIMTSTAMQTDYIVTPINFINGLTTTYGTNAQTTFGMPSGISAMWAGDATGDGRLNYLGSQSDTPLIRDQVFNDPDNTLFGGPPLASYQSQGYTSTDINMDGVSVYVGATSDILYVRDNIFNNSSNSLFGGPPTSTYVFIQQLVEGANN